MLTPQEITEKEFVKAVFGGYDMAVVDEFLEKLTEDYTALYKENGILKSKMKVLVDKVEEYRSTEDAMRMALLTAQKMGDDMVREAKEKSDAMLANAESESAQKLAGIQQEIEAEEARLNVAREATEAYTREAVALTEKLGRFLAAVPTLNIEKKAAEAPAPAPEEVREEQIMDAVHDIDSAVSRLTADEPAPAAEAAEAAEEAAEEIAAAAESAVEEAAESAIPTITIDTAAEVPSSVPKYDDEGEYTIRPKFDFDNLRFGANFDGDEN